ncbi:hypothetical protein AAD046_05860 [Providencia rettgeri]
MSSLNQFQHKKQFRCLPVSKCGPFQYVEIITLADESGNYQAVPQLVDDRKKLEEQWFSFYFLSGSEANVQ